MKYGRKLAWILTLSLLAGTACPAAVFASDADPVSAEDSVPASDASVTEEDPETPAVTEPGGDPADEGSGAGNETGQDGAGGAGDPDGTGENAGAVDAALPDAEGSPDGEDDALLSEETEEAEDGSGEQEDEAPAEETEEEELPEEEEEEELLTGLAIEDAAVAEGLYTIRIEAASSLVLDVESGSLLPKANVRIHKSNNTDAQKYRIMPRGNGTYYIINVKSGYALDVAGGKKVSGTNVWQYTFNGNASQTWYITPDGANVRIISALNTNLSLSAQGGLAVSDANICIEDTADSAAQRFALTPAAVSAESASAGLPSGIAVQEGYYYIHTALKFGMSAEVAGYSTAQNANVQLGTRVYSTGQMFEIKAAGNGQYTIRNVNSGRMLDVAGGKKVSGTNVWQHSANGSAAQKWVFVSAGDGNYYIVSAASGLALDAAGGKSRAGTNLQIYRRNNSTAQKWTLEQTALIPETSRTVSDGYYEIVPAANTKLSLDIQGGKITSNTNVQLHTANHTMAQKFRIAYVGNGLYSVFSLKSNMPLDVAGGKAGQGTNVWQHTNNRSKAQRWKITVNPDGTVTFISALGNYALSAADAVPVKGTNVVINKANGSVTQKFRLRSVTYSPGVTPGGQTFAGYIPDVSHWVPVSNWSKVKANCAFVITKATQGLDYVDNTLKDFVKNCESRSIPYWLYVFLDKGNEVAQTKFMVSTCRGIIGKSFCGYILDVERYNDPGNVKAAMNYLDALGVKSMIYVNYSNYDNMYGAIVDERSENCAFWEARYGKNDATVTDGHAGADLHQYTSVGTVPGISSTCDVSRLTGNRPLSWFLTPMTK